MGHDLLGKHAKMMVFLLCLLSGVFEKLGSNAAIRTRSVFLGYEPKYGR